MSIQTVTEDKSQPSLLDNRNILIVDDEEPIRRLLGYLLEPHGYQVTLAGESREARQRLEQGSYALVLCDVNMPGESGMDLVRHILAQYPTSAVIMITGLDSPVLANAALDMGAFGYVIKPFEANEVLINVANALRRRKLEIENAMHREHLEEVVRTRTIALQQALEWLERSKGIAPFSRRNDSTARHRGRVSRQLHGPAYPTHEPLL